MFKAIFVKLRDLYNSTKEVCIFIGMKRYINTLLILLFSIGFSYAEFSGLGTVLNRNVFGSSIGLSKTFGSAPDTLEIYAFKVQFKYEDDDNSLTTGRGHFDSDLDTNGANYSLDPLGQRGSSLYWEKHFEFATNYFKAVSNNNLVIESKIYPKNRDAYQLDKEIIDYNRTQKKSDEKTAEFDQARAEDYLNFIRDAVLQANTNEDSPFKDLAPTSQNRHRVYMIIHAGASRLVDGGSLGSAGADTPADFMDIFITEDAFTYLNNDDDTKKDSLGIVLNEASVDTLKEIMVVSETASQDGLNWGVNGIIINQIARQIGMPSTYDVVKGISRLGDFDVMDFAGYNAENGFLPVMPSAWIRAYMGWADVKEVRPGSDGKISEDVYSTFSNMGTEILKVPLAGSEYLLIENRQRTNGSLNEVTITLDNGEITVPSDSLHLLFQDSICVKGDCEVNKKKAKGIVRDISSFDAGLPASGLAVWHVNEWYIKQYLKYGFVNAWAGDTLRDHQFGIALVEADGSLTIGKEFQNSLGQPAFDYGSGADLLPHISQSLKDSKLSGNSASDFEKDTILEISPFGYANTGTTNDGRTHIRIRAKLPTDKSKYHVEKYEASYSGDTIRTFQSDYFTVEVLWGDLVLENSKWPIRIAPGNHAWGLSFMDYPVDNSLGDDESVLTIASNDGYIQMLDARGDSVYPNLDSLYYDARYDSVYSLLTTPSSEDSLHFYPVYSVHKNSSYSSTLSKDSILYLLNDSQISYLAFKSDGSIDSSKMELLGDSKYMAGPMLMNSEVSENGQNNIWFMQGEDLISVKFSENLSATDVLSSYKLEDENNEYIPQSMAKCGDQDGDGQNDLIVIYDYNYMGLYLSSQDEFISLKLDEDLNLKDSLPSQAWNIVCSDFNRDGSVDAYILGSLGSGAFIQGPFVEIAKDNSIKTLAKVSDYKSYMNLINNENLIHDFTGLALGDLNNDGYPEVVFAGQDLLWAIDGQEIERGIAIEGFPYRYNSKLPEGYLTSYGSAGAIRSAPIIADVDGDGLQDVLSSTPAGLIYAVNGSGKLLKEVSTSRSTDNVGALRAPLSDWPLAVNEYQYDDSLRSPYTDIYLHNSAGGAELELYALTNDHLYGWSLPKSIAKSYDWNSPAGGDLRQNYLDVSLLNDPQEIKSESKINEFYLYPNPIRSEYLDRVAIRLEIGATASSAKLKILDISGSVVIKKEYDNLDKGKHILEGLDFSKLGSDVYVVKVEVKFTDGVKKVKWDRVAVIK